MVDAAWNLGIRSFDTSNNYGMGAAESLLGAALGTAIVLAPLADSLGWAALEARRRAPCLGAVPLRTPAPPAGAMATGAARRFLERRRRTRWASRVAPM